MAPLVAVLYMARRVRTSVFARNCNTREVINLAYTQGWPGSSSYTPCLCQFSILYCSCCQIYIRIRESGDKTSTEVTLQTLWQRNDRVVSFSEAWMLVSHYICNPLKGAPGEWGTTPPDDTLEVNWSSTSTEMEAKRRSNPPDLDLQWCVFLVVHDYM